jgi:hypothetical protein
MNEYMAVEDERGERLASYPDVITTLDPSGEPRSVGEIAQGDELAVLRIAKDVIPLASSVRDPSLYRPVENALGIDLAIYALS